MKRNFRIISSILLLILAVAACNISPTTIETEEKTEVRTILQEERVEGIARIFYHSHRSWSIMVKTGQDTLSMRRFNMHHDYLGNVSFVTDIPQGSDMWMLVRYADQSARRDDDPKALQEIVFHIHSPRDITGGEWNHGKFGHGQTIALPTE